MTAASDVPDAVRPWLDALRAVWPDLVVTFSYSCGGWFDVKRPSRPEGWDCSIHSDGEAAFCECPDDSLGECFTPASLVACLRELLPVAADYGDGLEPEARTVAEARRDVERMAAAGAVRVLGNADNGATARFTAGKADAPTATYTCERCAISWVTADGARCPGCERAERRASREREQRPLAEWFHPATARFIAREVMARGRVPQGTDPVQHVYELAEMVEEHRARMDFMNEANPLRDASRRLVDELARYQRAGRGTPLPSEVVAAVEDVRAALEVGGE